MKHLRRIVLIIALTCAVHLSLFGQTVIPGRRALWRAENNALDSVGGNNAVLPVGATFVPDRSIPTTGYAFRLNGTSSRIPVAVLGTSLDTRRYTVAAWVRPDSTSVDSQTVISKTSPGSLNYMLFLAGSAPYPASFPTPNLPPNSAVVMFYIGDINAGLHYWAYSPQTCSASTWCHIAGSYDGTTLKIYFNGVLANSASANDQFVSSGQSVFIGNVGNGLLPFVGALDEIQMFDRALTDAEVMTIYNSIEPVGSGATGTPGPQGPIGPQGVSGPTGAVGPQGPSGITGPTGPVGMIGLTGPAGATGAQGVLGTTGAIGPLGATGAVGATGAPGTPGIQGIPGVVGATGLTGLPGTPGVPGIQGIPGATGAVGPIGATGATGTPGIQGIPGVVGATGLIGLPGTPGAPGIQGTPGATGPTGATGAVGPIGPIGGIGPQGIPGVAGATGPQGLPGTQGLPGSLGLPGVNGANGVPGLSGLQRVSNPCGAVTIVKGATYQSCNNPCPTGKLALGGGIQSTPNDNLTTVVSWPSQDNSWSTIVRNDDAKTATYILTAWAVCASVAP